MATEHHIVITATGGAPLATCTIDGVPTSKMTAQPGDTLAFSFVGPKDVTTTLSDAVLFSGPSQHCSEPSPFRSSQIQLTKHPKVLVENDGLWGFAIAFTLTQGSTSTFYFLPDPELEVGSTGT